MNTSAPEYSARAERPRRLVAVLAAGAALGWLIFRVFVGLDVTDEMQYYGEIAGLVRTNRFFQDDLFVQQLGYFFLLPFFKLHAFLFPDQSYLLVFGRLLMLGLYGGVAFLFWRCTGRTGAFSAASRLAGLGVLLAWIPFQILAPGYNSLAYLLGVALAAVWTTRTTKPAWSNAVGLGALAAALTTTYPPAGLMASGLLVLDERRRHGWLAAGTMLGWIVAAGVSIGGAMTVFHGRDFLADLIVTVKFSRAFGVGETIRQPAQLARLAAFGVSGGLLAVYIQRRAKNLSTSGAANPPAWWHTWAVAGATILLVGASLRWSIGYFAAAVFFVTLALAALSSVRPDARAHLSSLALAGVAMGVAFSITSGNGVHNFGVGAAAVLPFLALHAMSPAGAPGEMRRWWHAQSCLLAASAGLVLVNGVRHPYRERYTWDQLVPVQQIPAFRGIWTSALKIETLKIFAELAPPGSLRGQRVLVAGPHPVFYFVSGGEPATPMFFMHYSGSPEAYPLVAERLFRGGPPDAILVTNAMPDVIHRAINEWASRGCVERRVPVPERLRRSYQWLVGYDLLPEVVLLTRAGNRP